MNGKEQPPSSVGGKDHSRPLVNDPVQSQQKIDYEQPQRQSEEPYQMPEISQTYTNSKLYFYPFNF